MQFVAERRIENGLQFVTLIFLNPRNCLYIKKDCKFFQSYEKSSAKQNKFIYFFAETEYLRAKSAKLAKIIGIR